MYDGGSTERGFTFRSLGMGLLFGILLVSPPWRITWRSAKLSCSGSSSCTTDFTGGSIPWRRASASSQLMVVPYFLRVFCRVDILEGTTSETYKLKRRPYLEFLFPISVLLIYLPADGSMYLIQSNANDKL